MRILRSHYFNGCWYANIDNPKIEVKLRCEDAECPVDRLLALAKKTSGITAPPDPKPITTIADCTDEELKQELARRNAILRVVGEAL